MRAVDGMVANNLNGPNQILFQLQGGTYGCSIVDGGTGGAINVRSLNAGVNLISNVAFSFPSTRPAYRVQYLPPGQYMLVTGVPVTGVYVAITRIPGE